MDANLFQFALLFGVLGIAATVSLWFRFPVVPLYILSGMALGGVVEGDHVIEFLGSLGVVFLLFSMGLEFSLGSVTAAPQRFVRAGLIDWGLNFPVGLVVGLALGWSWIEALFLAGITYMSSSAVVSKCLADFGRAARPETEAILGIMVFEDLVIAAYLLLLNALTTASNLSDTGVLAQAWSLLQAAGFVLALILLARRFSVPLERLLASRSEESFTLLLFAFVLLVASAAIAVGLSEAVGAFFAGIVIGATQLKDRAARALSPFLTLFAALFFVSFGAGMELASFGGVAGPAILLVLLGIATKVVGGFLAGRATGHKPAPSAAIGLSLVPKGEFSILIAALAAGVASRESGIEAITAVYVLVLSIVGPVLMREADRIWAGLSSLFPPRKA